MNDWEILRDKDGRLERGETEEGLRTIRLLCPHKTRLSGRGVGAGRLARRQSSTFPVFFVFFKV